MSDINLREIIGIAKKSKWNQIKKFVKFIIRNTIKKDSGYNLTALEVSFNKKQNQKYDHNIKTKEEINIIDEIKDFKQLVLYQTTLNANNHINISSNNGTIIVLAKYLGPSLNNHQIFDFSVNLDVIDEPFFTIGNGKKITCTEILDFFDKKVKLKFTKKIGSSKNIPKNEEIYDKNKIEAIVFKKLTNKNAKWNGTETKIFQKWKIRTKNKYREETGNISYYKGKPTKKYSSYLKNLLKNIEVSREKPKKISDKSNFNINKNKLEEQCIFEKLTSKNAVWNGTETQNFKKWKKKIQKKYRTNTGKSVHYKGNPTKNYLSYLNSLLIKIDGKSDKPKEILNKKKSSEINAEKEISEYNIFENLTGKNVLWNGTETQNFIKWKKKIQKKYRTNTGKSVHYKGNPTKNYLSYLNSLLINIDGKRDKPKEILDKKKSSENYAEKEISEYNIFENLTGKNALWNGSETHNFIKWKKNIIKKYNKDTGKNPYYRNKLTKNFKDYLKKTLKILLSNKE